MGSSYTESTYGGTSSYMGSLTGRSSVTGLTSMTGMTNMTGMTGLTGLTEEYGGTGVYAYEEDMLEEKENDRYKKGAPKIEILEMKKNSMTIALSDCDLSIANALRRVMIAEVSSLFFSLAKLRNCALLFSFLSLNPQTNKKQKTTKRYQLSPSISSIYMRIPQF